MTGTGVAGFYASCRQRRHDVAAIEVDTGVSVTFGELGDRIDRLSRAIERRVEPGGVVAVVLPNGIAALEVELACTQLPIYFTPINWHLAPPEIAYILADSGASLVVTTEEHEAAVRTAAASAGLDARRVIVGGQGLDALADGEADGPPGRRGTGQRMLYTSGTTGRPKGVRRPLPQGVPEDNLGLLAARAALYGVDHPDGVHLVTAPMYHAAPGAYAVQALHLGHRVVIMTTWTPEATLDLIEAHGVTHTYMVPTMFSRLLGLAPERRASADVGSLRSVVHTAAPCPVHVKRAMMEWFGPILYEIYGGTEGGATIAPPDEWLAHPGTVGRARGGVTIRILDDDGNELPTGEPGAVYMSIPAQRFAYLNDPEKTASSRRGEFFTLGDIGYLNEDGYLFLCDRAADVVVSGGVNIYPAEVESALLEHLDVVDAAVIGAPDDEWGERLVAHVVTSSVVAVDELIAHCRALIAGYKCPREIRFRDELPRSDVGKLLRRTLRDEEWAGRERRL